VCLLPGKFGWNPFSSLIEIAGERQAPRTGRFYRVAINSPTFLVHGLVDFCAISTTRYRIYPARIRRRCLFWKLPSFGCHVAFSVGGSSQKWHLCCPNLTLYRFQFFDHTLTIPAQLPSTWKVWLRSVQRHLRRRRRRRQCNDLKCVRKPTKRRLSLTHHANKSSRWAE